MKGDHRFVEIRLERSVASFKKPIVGEIAFQSFDRSLDRGPAGHHGFESLRHRRIARIDMGQGFERKGRDASAGRQRATGRLVIATRANRFAAFVSRRPVDKSLGFVTRPHVFHLESALAGHRALRRHLFHAFRKVFRQILYASGIHGGFQIDAEFLSQELLQNIVVRGAVVQNEIDPILDSRQIFEKSRHMLKDRRPVVTGGVRDGRGADRDPLQGEAQYGRFVPPYDSRRAFYYGSGSVVG